MFLLSKQFRSARRIPEDFGYKLLFYRFQGDPVEVLVISKPGENRVPKPLLLYCQPGAAVPIITYDGSGIHSLPFAAEEFCEEYHVIIIGKPFIPVIANSDMPDEGGNQRNGMKTSARQFRDRHHLNYYVYRNHSILKQLSAERWVRSNGLVVSGSGEGSAIASKLASSYRKVSKLIYSSGNPYGPLMPPDIQNSEHDTHAAYWSAAVNARDGAENGEFETHKSRLSFSMPHKEQLIALDIPVLVTYGANDDAAPFLRLFHIESILARKSNISHSVPEGEVRNLHSGRCLNGELSSDWRAATTVWKNWLA